ncbi:MAG TPA: PD-(D/E)XK nuclease family protein, partial [Verrucomicrobiae bacterium]|nr:PD-(D/E)XK nuclease family protein [Verrucomicrobiae bacterium]
ARAKWPERASATPAARLLLHGSSFLDWLGPWFTQSTGDSDWTDREQGAAATWTWRIHRDAESPERPLPIETEMPAAAAHAASSPGDETMAALRQRLDWRYPHAATARTPAKSSVTVLRRQWMEADEEAQPVRFAGRPRFEFARSGGSKLSAGEVGSAHHNFLQWVALDRTGSLESLRKEGERLQQSGRLSAEELASLRWDDLAAFWQSDLGRSLRQESVRVRRELPFICRLTAEDLQAFELPPVAAVPSGEFVVVQGVVDLAVMREDEIWLLDFKTDRVTPATLAAKVAAYKSQLQLYALALQRIHGRPVTKRWLHFLALGETMDT